MPDIAYVYRWNDALIPRIKAALEAEDLKSYRISIGSDAQMRRCLEAAINDQVIDSHLEAVNFSQGSETRALGRASEVFEFDAETLHVLIRRLAEPLPQHWEINLNDDASMFDAFNPEYSLGDAMQSLANDILSTLDIPAEICG
jgi:hypothetical protein